jgi:hypothetical protein
MFDRSKLSPDDEMYEHVDDINRAITDVRSHLTDEIKIDPELSHTRAPLYAQSHGTHRRAAAISTLVLSDAGLSVAARMVRASS